MQFIIDESDEGRFTVHFEDHQGRRPYFRASHASSAYGMVVEGLKRLAVVRPGDEATVVDPTGGYTGWVRTNSQGGRRRIPGLPGHSVVSA